MISPESELINILDGASSDESGEPRPASNSLPAVLPVLGLSDIVIFPGMVAPLLVESASSIRLIDDVVAGDRFLGLVLQRSEEVENPRPEDLWRTGCAGRVLKMLKFPDGSVRVLVEGLRRLKIKSYVVRQPYLKARVRVLEDIVDSSIEFDAMLRNSKQQFQEIVSISPSLSEQVKVAALNEDSPGKLADMMATNLNLSLDERQHLLEVQRVKERLSRLLPLLSRELEILTLGSKIQKEVTTSMSKSQRDFFLREQIRAIQRELGESDPSIGEIENLRAEIEKNKLPQEVKTVALRELDRLQQIPPAVAEYTVSRNYLDWLVRLPWSRSTDKNIDLKAAERILNRNHYGLESVKERLLEFLAVIKLKQKLKGPILCLVGPPGVGKTSVGQSVAEALGRKFARIALGGMRDEAEIRGHRRTYVGALPGRIIQSIRRVDSNNPVILLDEIDKVGADFRGDPASALLEVLDPQQNHTFTDNYLDLPFDLSGVLFITTANWLDPIHPALKDRLEIIELPSYTESEKLEIARRHLMPRQYAEHGLKKSQLKVSVPALRELIRDYTREAGVRQMEREIARVARKAARKLVARKQTKSIQVTPENLESFLGAPKFRQEVAETIREYGIATGLAWTPVGGNILFIEATRMPGTGKVSLTGSLGDVMKESAQTALSYLRSQASRLKLNMDEHDKFDVHIHVPAGATPKDGPSAGVTIVTALASLFSRRLVKSNLAMSGEISLRGRVLPVGGVKEKVLAASRSGITHVLLPEDNRNDWKEVPIEVRRSMKVHFIKEISELIRHALRPRN